MFALVLILHFIRVIAFSFSNIVKLFQQFILINLYHPYEDGDNIIVSVIPAALPLAGSYERASAASERSLFNLTEKSQYERSGPARPERLLIGSYLSSRWAD